jgi:hypothetical protein
VAGGGCVPQVLLAGQDDGSTGLIRGILHRRTPADAGEVLGIVISTGGGRCTTTEALEGTTAFQSSEWNRGGTVYSWEVWKPTGAATNTWLTRLSAGGSAGGFYDQGSHSSDSSTHTDWNSQEFERVGLGVYNAGAAGNVTRFDVTDLRILRHPQDRTGVGAPPVVGDVDAGDVDFTRPRTSRPQSSRSTPM